jgi:hypothetical protein
MGLSKRIRLDAPHDAPAGSEAPANYDNSQPDELLTWESAWIDLGGEG